MKDEIQSLIQKYNDAKVEEKIFLNQWENIYKEAKTISSKNILEMKIKIHTERIKLLHEFINDLELIYR